jgi:hypothetical protein
MERRAETPTALLTSPGLAHPGVDISMLCASYFVWTASPSSHLPFFFFSLLPSHHFDPLKCFLPTISSSFSILVTL